MYVGTAPDSSTAAEAIAAVGAQIYAYVEPGDGAGGPVGILGVAKP